MIFKPSHAAASAKNRLHVSKEVLAVFHSAHIVPQGSPLLVRLLLGVGTWKVTWSVIYDCFYL